MLPHICPQTLLGPLFLHRNELILLFPTIFAISATAGVHNQKMHRPAFLTFPALPRLRRHVSAVSPVRMSGVNGGIDYEIDLDSLPLTLARRIAYIQSGPDSPTSLISAAQEIATSSKTHPQTLPVLVDMLGFNNPVAARIAIDALSEAGKPALPALLRGVAAFNYAVNAYALRAIANVGDPSVVDVVLACAERGPIPNVRRAAVRALGQLRYDSVEQAQKAYGMLLHLADAEPDWGVRYAALAALQAFVKDDLVGDEMLEQAIQAVQSAADGRAKVLKQAEEEEGHVRDVPVDRTVAARAFVALEVLKERHRHLVTAKQTTFT